MTAGAYGCLKLVTTHLVDLCKADDSPQDRTNTKAATVAVVCSPLPNCDTQVTRVIFGYESYVWRLSEYDDLLAPMIAIEIEMR